MKIAVIGGDDRQCSAARILSASGHAVAAWGLNAPGINNEETAQKAVGSARLILLPLPASRRKGFINAPRFDRDIAIDEVFDHIGSGATVLAGLPDMHIRDACDARGLRLVDYGAREEIAVDGAVSTTEAAVALIVESTADTIAGSDILVIGAGRIGTRLAQILHAMGAKVTVSARKSGDLARIAAQGFGALHTSVVGGAVERFDVIVNTVPYPVLDAAAVNSLKIGCFLLDLASVPGGVDAVAANKAKVNYKWALSLPGKTAPESAGRSVARTILNIIAENEGDIL